MARLARIVVPRYPHHVTQRGNRRQKTFFADSDYRIYMKLLAEAKAESGVEFWAYCLMPNHVHFVAVPEHKDSLANLFRIAHRQYSRCINFREGWRGHLWQERFHSFVMDEYHLFAAVRYIELNPVRAGLCHHPEDWNWSSVHAHIEGKDDALVTVHPLLDRINDWLDYLAAPVDDACWDRIRVHTRTGRPAGPVLFIEQLEAITGRQLQKKSPGRKPTR